MNKKVKNSKKVFQSAFGCTQLVKIHNKHWKAPTYPHIVDKDQAKAASQILCKASCYDRKLPLYIMINIFIINHYSVEI